jgi:hypothetical protein
MMSARPTVDLDALSAALKTRQQWLVWQYEERASSERFCQSRRKAGQLRLSRLSYLVPRRSRIRPGGPDERRREAHDTAGGGDAEAGGGSAVITLPQDLTVEAFLRRADALRRVRAIPDCQLWPSFEAQACRTSETLAKLTHGAERFCWRLTTYADDWGRFPVSAAVPREQGLL